MDAPAAGRPTLDRIRFRGDPVADPAAVVVAGRARLTALTARLLRLEWAPDGRFEDRASFAFPVRRGSAPRLAVERAGDTVTVDTGALRVRLVDDGRPFHPDNLRVELTGDVAATWVPGLADPDNLGGARRTVDDCRGEAVLEPGLVSRSGWAVHDDSALAVFDAAGWPVARDHAGALDWYFFGHGHDYAGAVAEYARFGGAAPLVPRWVLGAWWSRYHAYDEAELRELVEGFERRDLPLDVVVVDMDWHLPDAWTGYTWNRELFPDPAAFLAWLHGRGLRTTLNLHPAQGVQAFEAAYPEFARRLGVDPATGDAVPFDITDPAFVEAYLELLHHPREDEGVDFWWMDWQQGRTSAVEGLDPLTWLNHLHHTDLRRVPGRRPVVFSRWGGLGSHRYPVGFSGDSFALWSALEFQPRYTAAGANVGYGWWSHDIGGHSGPDTPELYVRWVQSGAVSPVLRLHSNNQRESERRPWGFDEATLDLAREAFALRYALVPYLYTAARDGMDTGAAVARPTAWVAPEHDGAYLARAQYLLGPDLLVAPVVRPADPATGLADVDVWLPPGKWVERGSGETATGPGWLRLGAGPGHVPQFVRPGTVLPLAVAGPTGSPAAHDPRVLEVHGGAAGHARLYDDDGVTTDPDAGAWTELDLTAPAPDHWRLTVTPGVARGWTVRVPAVARPREVALDGSPVTGWTHDGDVLEVPVPAGDRPFTLDLLGEGPLTRRGAGRDAERRAADVARVTGGAADPHAGVAALPVDGAARALAVARLGGPAVQVHEVTTPPDAARTLGRVVVSAARDGSPVAVEARWTLERGGVEESFDVETTVDGEASVLDAPFAWDGDLTPCRWSVEVRALWSGDLPVVRRHTSAVLNPAAASWWVAVDGGDPWERFEPDTGDVDYGSLAQRTTVRFRGWNADTPAGEPVGRAVTTLETAGERDVAIAYVAGGPVEVSVDGHPVTADVTGAPGVKYFTLDPPVRRTAAVHLGAGRHRVELVCRRPDGLADIDWYVTAWAAEPADGAVALDVVARAGDRPGAPAGA